MNPQREARCLAVLGTASHVGKSLVVAALCRIFADQGVRVAPFKGQNMSLNAAVTPEGLEIGRSQALQAQAARLAPNVHMGPLLLKPEGDGRLQVVLQGRVQPGSPSSQQLWGKITESLALLRSHYDLVVIEGSGSPVELNLMTRDLGNLRLAREADAQALLVADIDRGGVFAAVQGTLALMPAADRRRVLGIVVNRFRGEPQAFADGVQILQRLSAKPVLGVLPYIDDLALDEEDGAGLQGPRYRRRPLPEGALRIGIIALPEMSNFTDFDPLFADPKLDVGFYRQAKELGGLHLIILPGSKNTLSDLAWLRQRGLAAAIAAHHARGGHVLGLCGGYQMLGRVVRDPQHVESDRSEGEGLGLLDAVSVLTRHKQQAIVRATVDRRFGHLEVCGYELHMGVTQTQAGTAFARIADTDRADGLISEDGRVIGTYLHGILHNDEFRRLYLDALRQRLNLAWAPVPSQAGAAERAIDRLADTVAAHLDLPRIKASLGL